MERWIGTVEPASGQPLTRVGIARAADARQVRLVGSNKSRIDRYFMREMAAMIQSSPMSLLRRLALSRLSSAFWTAAVTAAVVRNQLCAPSS